MGTKIRVVVDDREKELEVRRGWERDPDVEVVVRRLPLGDYQVDELACFERKTFADFGASIRDGRLFHQAIRLVSSGKRCALILEGTSSDVSAMHLPRHGIQGAIVSLTLIIGLPILRSTGPEETGRLILYAARQLRAIRRGALPYRGYRPRGKRRGQLRLLQDLPGVGAQRAVQLLDAFGSVEAVMMADEEELLEVSGIGADTARKIRRLVSESRAPYWGTGGTS